MHIGARKLLAFCECSQLRTGATVGPYERARRWCCAVSSRTLVVSAQVPCMTTSYFGGHRASYFARSTMANNSRFQEEGATYPSHSQIDDTEE